MRSRAFCRNVSVTSILWTRLACSASAATISSTDSSCTSKPQFIPMALHESFFRTMSRPSCPIRFLPLHVRFADLLPRGLEKTVLPPEATLLVAHLLRGGPVAVEVPLGALDGPDQVFLPHPAGRDPPLPCDGAYLPHLHAASPLRLADRATADLLLHTVYRYVVPSERAGEPGRGT